MATTHTVTSPASGDLLYSFTALATGDTFDIDASAAKSILFQITGGTFGGTPAVCALTGSLNGTNWAPLFCKQQLTTGVAVTLDVKATSANTTIFDVQPTRFVRVQVTETGGSNITCNVLIRTLHG
jgi:hypothetical protein